MFSQAKEKAGWFVANFKREGLRKAVAVLIHNTRWRLGYLIGPFHHACDTPDCSRCLD